MEFKDFINEGRSGFIGISAQKKPPTKNHRPAIWENMLGTVYAMNDSFETKYFDYNWDAAKEYAGISNKKDVRIYKDPGGVNWTGQGPDTNPGKGKLCLWVEGGPIKYASDVKK